MAFNTPAVLDAVVALLTGLEGMQSVTKGVPETLGTRVSAYVTMGRQAPRDKATGRLLTKDGRIRVVFGYRVSKEEASAEADLTAMVDRFHVAFYAAKKTNLGGTVTSLRDLDDSAADLADYEMVRGQEYRRYPVDILFTQEANY
jgi:hypothetical protein